MTRLFAGLLAAILASSVLSVFLNSYTVLNSENWGWSCVYLSVVFLALGIFYLRKDSPSELVGALLAGFVVRFLAGLIFLLIVFLFRREGFFNLALHYVIQWFLFTVSEIAYLSIPTQKSTHR